MNNIEVCRDGKCRRYDKQWVCGLTEESGFLVGAGVKELVVKGEGGVYARLMDGASGENILETRRGLGVSADNYHKVIVDFNGGDTSIRMIRPKNGVVRRIVNFFRR